MAVGEPKIIEIVITKSAEVVGEVLHAQGAAAEMATQFPAGQSPRVFGQLLVHHSPISARTFFILSAQPSCSSM